MPIKFVSKRKDGHQLLIRRLLKQRRIPQDVSADVISQLAANARSLELKMCHRHYLLRIAAISNGDGLEAAQFVAVRHLIVVAGQTIGAGEICLGDDGALSKIGKLSFGNYPQFAADGFDLLAGYAQVQAGKYGAQFLIVPGLSLFCIWLKSLDESGDIIYPIGKGWGMVNSGHAYEAGEFLTILRPYASAALQRHRKWRLEHPGLFNPKLRSPKAGPGRGLP
jgi:hypothetical protein